MILVTLGTQKHSFMRLLNMVSTITNEEIVIQKGFTKYENPNVKIYDFVSYEEMTNLIKKARIIITHGGTGSIVMPLKMSKIVIACPRLKKYKEHINDHQVEIVNNFYDKGYLIKLNECDDLNYMIKNIDHYHLKAYKSNQANFIDRIERDIEDENV